MCVCVMRWGLSTHGTAVSPAVSNSSPCLSQHGVGCVHNMLCVCVCVESVWVYVCAFVPRNFPEYVWGCWGMCRVCVLGYVGVCVGVCVGCVCVCVCVMRWG